MDVIGRAAGAWRTLRLAGHEWRHEDLLHRAFQREVARVGRHSSLTQLIATKDGAAEPQTREPWRLWLARPDHIRTEFRVGDETVIAIFAGTRWWSLSPRGFLSNDGDPSHGHGIGPGEALLDPARHMAHLRVLSTPPATFLSRLTTLVSAEPQPAEDPDSTFALHALGAGADRYELITDTETGVLLRTEARLEGRPFRVIEVDDIAVDELFVEPTFDPERLRAGMADL